jgi:hypothetical protein
MAGRQAELAAALEARQDAQAERVRTLTEALGEAEARAKKDPTAANVVAVMEAQSEVDAARKSMISRVSLGRSRGPGLMKGRVTRNVGHSDDWRIDRY